jgi:hypothetical protein
MFVRSAAESALRVVSCQRDNVVRRHGALVRTKAHRLVRLGGALPTQAECAVVRQASTFISREDWRSTASRVGGEATHLSALSDRPEPQFDQILPGGTRTGAFFSSLNAVEQ